MARFTLLALGAAAEAIQDSGIDCEAEAENIGVIVSSGIGGLPTIEEQHSRGEEKGMEKVSPYFVPMAIANMAAAQIAIRFGLKGMCTCPVTACAGGTNAVGDAFHRIRDGYEPVMVCGGAESCISPLGIGGFTSMKALSTLRPRCGQPALRRTARRLCDGRGQRCAGAGRAGARQGPRRAHLCRSRGLRRQLRRLPLHGSRTGGAARHRLHEADLKDGGIAPEQIDHINAHGTGTHMNKQLRDCCHPRRLRRPRQGHRRRQHQSVTGHLLGGAGGIEAVFTALALRDQFAPPTIHYEQPDPECDLDYVPNVAVDEDGVRSEQQPGLRRTQRLPGLQEVGGLSDGRTPHRA